MHPQNVSSKLDHPIQNGLRNQFCSLVHRMSQRKCQRVDIFPTSRLRCRPFPPRIDRVYLLQQQPRISWPSLAATQFSSKLVQTKPARWQQLRTTRDWGQSGQNRKRGDTEEFGREEKSVKGVCGAGRWGGSSAWPALPAASQAQHAQQVAPSAQGDLLSLI